ncbi:uncharacterized protein mxra7 [Eucyclogobius newberryi]|uniref:uncharacterized protein mxra7 n=1 Tax=Eucyclogobius newberryi TaxID=166745 RepID=UPI003B5A23FA
MDVSFVVAAVIFTLLAIVVATSLFTGTSPASSDYGRGGAGSAAAEEPSSPAKRNGHVPLPASPERKPGKAAELDWCETSGSAHDHWDVVRDVRSSDLQRRVQEEDQLTSDLTSDLSRPPSSSSSGRGSYMGLTDTELLKCAFPLPQTEGAAESPDHSDKVESDSYRYVPGKSRSHHLQMMMSRDELEEEQSSGSEKSESWCFLRVQRQQLAAIFQLLKNNKDTFGDVSPGDMEEQLKLYSI